MTSGDMSFFAWISPWTLGILGLCIGSFLNVVIHRLPQMMERQWWQDAASQLADAESWKRCFGKEAPRPLAATASEIEQEVHALKPMGLAGPASRCPVCHHRSAGMKTSPC